jgi:putative nucleotide binding protein
MSSGGTEMSEPPKRVYEDYAYVLEYLPYGHPLDSRPTYQRESLVQVVGDEHLTLLECVPKPGSAFQPREHVYIGKEARTKVAHIRRRITYEDLTVNARAELPFVLDEVVKAKEPRFIAFLNEAGPLNVRMHQLELLPGVGKKTMWMLLEERKKGPFQSFEDISKRVKISNPRKIIADRILEELRGGERYLLFVRGPK